MAEFLFKFGDTRAWPPLSLFADIKMPNWFSFDIIGGDFPSKTREFGPGGKTEGRKTTHVVLPML